MIKTRPPHEKQINGTSEGEKKEEIESDRPNKCLLSAATAPCQNEPARNFSSAAAPPRTPGAQNKFAWLRSRGCAADRGFAPFLRPGTDGGDLLLGSGADSLARPWDELGALASEAFITPVGRRCLVGII
jgi:hypothetical protein